MKFVIIFGPQAVWKMTVGHELEKITGLKLFHNHMTIDLIAPLFGYWSKAPIGKALVEEFRNRIFEEFAKSDNEWMIFTYVWAFDLIEDQDYIEKISHIFKSRWSDIYWIELEANINERIKRNITPHRLKHKPTKRDTKWSENELKESMKEHRLNSKEWEIKYENYMKIDNTNLNPDEVAKMIVRKFWL